MKIILTSWAPFIGGAEVAVERLALGLTQDGHHVLLVVGTQGEAIKRFHRAGIATHFIPQQFTDKWKWLQYRKSRQQLTSLLGRERPDIVHSNDLPTHQLTADAAARVGIPRVCHHRWIFDGPAIDWMNKFGAERHLFVSDALMQDLVSESPTLAVSERRVVYDGLPLPPVPSEEQRLQARSELNLPGDQQIVLFAGQIIERKGVADLLHAWKTLHSEAPPNAQLIIVGDDLAGKGEYLLQMKELAENLQIEVHFKGFQKNVDRWLIASDFVLVPSHAEPLGNATLEAMSQSRAVIGTRVGGIPEMVVHEETGLLASAKSPNELAEAIQRLLCSPELSKELGKRARERCEQKFSLAAHVNEVISQYEQTLSKHSNLSQV